MQAAAREIAEECSLQRGVSAGARGRTGGRQPTGAALQTHYTLHPAPFTATDAIFAGEGGDWAFHYQIAQCYGVLTTPEHVSAAVAGDDADAVGWFTLGEIEALEREQGYGGAAAVAVRALQLSAAGVLPCP